MVVVQPLTEVTSPKLFTVAALQSSVAVGAVNDGVAVHSSVALGPAAPITGAALSTTVIVWLTVADVLPHPSTAFHVLVIVLVQPLTAVISPRLFTVTALHASVAVGGVKDGVAVQFIVALDPADPITGAELSATVI